MYEEKIYRGNRQVERWKDGWMDGWMDRWMDGQVDGWMDDVQMNGWVDEQMRDKKYVQREIHNYRIKMSY